MCISLSNLRTPIFTYGDIGEYDRDFDDDYDEDENNERESVWVYKCIQLL